MSEALGKRIDEKVKQLEELKGLFGVIREEEPIKMLTKQIAFNMFIAGCDFLITNLLSIRKLITS